MIVPPVIVRRFTDIEPFLKFVGDRVENTVFSYCKREGYAYTARYKTPTSLAEKLETGRVASWSEIDDLFGCTIVIPSLAQEEFVLAFLRDVFAEVETKSRRDVQKDPLVFRFDATRFIGRLKSMQEETNTVIREQRFEIQIRSAFEHAWSVATHALAYKGNTVDWRTLRLASQLKATVEQLDMLIIGFDEAASVIAAQGWPELQSKKSIEGFFRWLVAAGHIPSEAAPENWPRFAENVYSVIREVRGFRRDRSVESTADVLAIIQGAILALDPMSFPRSISLAQFVIGVLTRGGQLPIALKKHTPLVTAELRELFPETGDAADAVRFPRLITLRSEVAVALPPAAISSSSARTSSAQG